MSTAQLYHQNMVHYLRKDISYADDGTSVTVGTIPSGSIVLPAISGAYVTTAFNGGTTNTVDIGISGSTQKYASALALGTLGHIELDVITDASANSSLTTADETILAGVVSTAGATAGAASVVIAYIPPHTP